MASYAVLALNLFIATLFVVRRVERRRASVTQIVQSLPALAVGAAAVAIAIDAAVWSPLPLVLLLGGLSFSLWAFAHLGRSFAVLPGHRETVTRGPYRLVRHPAYLGELAMITSVAIAASSWLAAALLLALVPLLMLRIAAEERVLMGDAAYRHYVRAARWRLVPGLW